VEDAEAAPAFHPQQAVASCARDPLSIDNLRQSCAACIDSEMGTKSRERIYDASVRAIAERASAARKASDRLACEAWTARMLGFQGPAQPSHPRQLAML
jgi:hypothetical protein